MTRAESTKPRNELVLGHGQAPPYELWGRAVRISHDPPHPLPSTKRAIGTPQDYGVEPQ
ncbi:MAG: hypothetical protein MZV64_64155 [Ignavibacteriales bacterium]|nr:hypothetical protein [Ignavibacteriales bacterium]